MKLLLVDDHALVRAGLRRVLEADCPGVEVREAGTAAEGLKVILAQGADLVVLDVSLPGRNGLELLADLRKAAPQVPVLVLSMHREEEFALRAIRGGASGYLTKDSAAAELVTAVRKVLAGGRYVSPELAEHLAAAIAGDPVEAHRTLSDRELQTLERLAAGRSLKEIAAELSLSAKTVSTYRRRLLQKLGLRTNVDLARYALAHRLVS